MSPPRATPRRSSSSRPASSWTSGSRSLLAFCSWSHTLRYCYVQSYKNLSIPRMVVFLMNLGFGWNGKSSLLKPYGSSNGMQVNRVEKSLFSNGRTFHNSSRSTILAKLMPLWCPVLHAYNINVSCFSLGSLNWRCVNYISQLPDHIRVRLQSIHDSAPQRPHTGQVN